MRLTHDLEQPTLTTNSRRPVHQQGDDFFFLAFGGITFYRTLRPILIGVVHGLAVSEAVALLVLPIIRNPVWAMAYLQIFGLGTIMGMMLITAAIAVSIAYGANWFQFASRYLEAAPGVMSLAFGAFLFYQIGFVDRLFTR